MFVQTLLLENIRSYILATTQLSYGLKTMPPNKKH